MNAVQITCNMSNQSVFVYILYLSMLFQRKLVAYYLCILIFMVGNTISYGLWLDFKLEVKAQPEEKTTNL